MKSYQYEGLDSAGNRTKGFCTAENESAAARHCREEGVYLIRLRTARGGFLQKKKSGRRAAKRSCCSLNEWPFY